MFLAALLVAPFSHAGIESLFDRNGYVLVPRVNEVETRALVPVNAVAQNGSRALVTETVGVTVGRATMAANAAKLATRAIPIVSTAFLAYQLYDAIKSTGVATCPPPAFFCTPNVPGGVQPAPDGLWQWTGAGDNRTYARSSPQGVCTMLQDIYAASFPPDQWTFRCIKTDNTFTPDYYDWWADNATTNQHVRQGQIKPVNVGSCPAGTTFDAATSQCSGAGTPGAPFADDQALADAMMKNDWNGAVSEKIWRGIEAEMARSPGTLTFKDALGGLSPVTVTGQPVTGPEVTTSTKTSPNADGSTSTEVKKEQTTFTPGQDGSTVNDTVPKVKETTVTTTTVTNNTTNTTNTTTTTTTPPASAEEKSDLCKLHPEIVACQKLGTPLEATPIKDKSVALTITRSDGWGPSTGACPAPGHFTAQGKTLEFSWDFFCRYADGIRPFVLAMAYLIAVGAFMGTTRKS